MAERSGDRLKLETIRSIELGKSEHPARSRLEAIAVLLDCSVDLLILKAYTPA
jgi:hypothetical protein